MLLLDAVYSVSLSVFHNRAWILFQEEGGGDGGGCMSLIWGEVELSSHLNVWSLSVFVFLQLMQLYAESFCSEDTCRNLKGSLFSNLEFIYF